MNKTLELISQFAYSFPSTVKHTYDMAKKCASLDGVYVECGVGGGAQVAAMQLALTDIGVTKHIYGFDSFEGIPLGNEKDIEQPGIGKPRHDQSTPVAERLVSSGVTVHSLANVYANLRKVGVSADKIHFRVGWFQNTIPSNELGKIALLRLDGDLYESTMVCLEYLYPKVVKGGVMVIDDYSLAGCRSAVHEYFGNKLPKMQKVEGGGGVVFFVKK